MFAERRRLFLFVPPIAVLFICRCLIEAHGPNYLAFNFDPEYAYLFNSLLLLNFHTPGLYQHPGATVELLGAVVVLFKHILTHGSLNIQNLNTSVQSHPETYLFAIHSAIIVLLMAAVLWTGWMIASRKGLVFCCLFFAICFSFTSVLRSLTTVTPEPLLLISSLLVIAVIQIELANSPKWTPVALGILIGFGLATKITFAPLCLAILIPQTGKRRIIALFSFFVSLFLFTLPLLYHYRHLLHWTERLIIYNDVYGTGSAGLPPLNRIFNNTASMIRQIVNPKYALRKLISRSETLYRVETVLQQ
jgi:hypothetical protein